jgi:hypothetical protein
MLGAEPRRKAASARPVNEKAFRLGGSVEKTLSPETAERHFSPVGTATLAR